MFTLALDLLLRCGPRLADGHSARLGLSAVLDLLAARLELLDPLLAQLSTGDSVAMTQHGSVANDSLASVPR